MARVIWSPQALVDLEAIGDYLAYESPAYAQTFIDGIFSVVDRLEIFPNSGRMVPEIGDNSIREVIYKGYRIIHIIAGVEESENVKGVGRVAFHSPVWRK